MEILRVQGLTGLSARKIFTSYYLKKEIIYLKTTEREEKFLVERIPFAVAWIFQLLSQRANTWSVSF